ncbi:MAG: flagellar motor switch protein FliM [Phycisphaeraceae bacterium]|nr:flagellar motor switch protein FliM [Phycisphaerales bacterium]MCB9859261.1 flagellar motor switch protein FliM [Phycisphaeraceae bacterium]
MDILDQSEVDALLAAVGGAEPEPEEDGDLSVFSRHRTSIENVEIRPYDFKRPERVSKDQMRALQTLHETFARNFGAALSGFLRTIIEVRVATCEQMTYAEFIASLPNPTSFNLIGSDSLNGQMCLEISPLIIYPVIDKLLGGSAQELFIPQRPATAIENRLITQVIRRAMTSLSEAWDGVRELKFHVESTESNPQLVQIVPPNEVVVVVGFEMKMSNRAGTINLCIPYNVIEPVMDDLSSTSWFSASLKGQTQEMRERIKESIGIAGVSVSGVLTTTTVSIQDLINLSVGDIIMTETNSSAPVTLCVEGKPKFTAIVGKHRNKRALQIKDKIQTSKERRQSAKSADTAEAPEINVTAGSSGPIPIRPTK